MYSHSHYGSHNASHYAFPSTGTLACNVMATASQLISICTIHDTMSTIISASCTSAHDDTIRLQQQPPPQWPQFTPGPAMPSSQKQAATSKVNSLRYLQNNNYA